MQRIALYSQDTHGVGRLRRNIAIARALADEEPRAVLLISGAGEPAVGALPKGADTLCLPALPDDEGAVGARCLGIGTAALVRLRSEVLRNALQAFRPDVLIVDRQPTGMEGELTPSFDVLEAMGTRLVLGLPEVLGDHERVRADWELTNAFDVIRDRYHEVWVYGDPEVFDPVEEYGMPSEVAERVHYTGYLDGARANPPVPMAAAAVREELGLGDGPVCVCLAGGTPDGVRLADAFARAPLPEGTTGVVLTGPFMTPDDAAALRAVAARRDDMRIVDLLPGADTLIWLADHVISMGGYHTTAEAVAAGRRALVVPSAQGRPDQLIRARRLRALGAVDLLEPDHLTPAALGAWVALGARHTVPPATDIDTDGLDRLPLLLEALVAPVAPMRRTGRFTRGQRPAAAADVDYASAG